MDAGMPNPQRRAIMLGILGTPLLALGAGAAADGPVAGSALPPWQPGCLDIHHIDTGRGNATLVILPDGTSLLVDAGASASALDVSAAPKPDAGRRPGEWVARYLRRHLRATGRSGLDYLLVSHFHPDHLGDVGAASPKSANGAYRLTGVMDVAEELVVGTLVDRGFPSYDYPASPAGMGPFAQNYLAFVRERVRQGLRVERFEAGRGDQFRARSAGAFGVRNIAVNGQVWTGSGQATHQMFPPLASLPAADWPTENMCSAAIRVHSGDFAYFTAGDMTSYTLDGDQPWRDMLGAAALVAGPVNVATADHHGLFDGLSGDVVRRLRPQVWVIPSWHISHPDTLQLERMLSTRLYPGPRDVFATGVMHENYLANRRLMQHLQSTGGHVVIRVQPGGAAFSVAVTDNADERDIVKLVTGPYGVAARRTPAPA
jgi:glyoxylase-like metal-dependent hydrolase (beta-lactamase superfamily II)